MAASSSSALRGVVSEQPGLLSPEDAKILNYRGIREDTLNLLILDDYNAWPFLTDLPSVRTIIERNGEEKKESKEEVKPSEEKPCENLEAFCTRYQLNYESLSKFPYRRRFKTGLSRRIN